MAGTASLPPDYFEQMFAHNPDPWDFASSAYEAEKFATSIAALEERRYSRGLEVGCANGDFTANLASFCQDLVAIDVSETALKRAREHNAHNHHVRFSNMKFPEHTPEGTFDLIVMSEVVYYWSQSDIAAAGAWIKKSIEPQGDLLLVHWTGNTDYPQTADNAVKLLRNAVTKASVITASSHENYRLDLWRMP